MSSFAHVRAKKAVPWSWLAAAIKDPNFAIVMAFCAIGLLASINVILRIPDFGVILGQLN
jgi:hypothetical protein